MLEDDAGHTPRVEPGRNLLSFEFPVEVPEPPPGQITIADPVTSSTVSAVIDAASFATGNPQRDKDVKSARFLHVRDHPQITFRSTELVRDGDAWRLRGQITARGTTAPAELTITEATASEDVLLIRATTRIDRYAHGLTRAKGIAGRHLAMEITARAPLHAQNFPSRAPQVNDATAAATVPNGGYSRGWRSRAVTICSEPSVLGAAKSGVGEPVPADGIVTSDVTTSS